MWMIAPIPETKTAIVLLNGSSVRPSGTSKIPLIAIHVNLAATVVWFAKIRQLKIKLTSTATIEMELLNVFQCRVNSVITAALTSGASRMTHGKVKFIQSVSLEFQGADVFDVRCLPCAKQRDEKGKANGHFGSCHGDDEKYEHLRVVIGQAVWIETETRKSNERKVCSIQHQLQRHENDDQVASQHHAGKADGKKNAAYEQVIAKCDHATLK